jgi:hypothetical protein
VNREWEKPVPGEGMNIFGFPGRLSPIRGQGTGFRWQRERKSAAYFEGRITRFAWMWPGARLAVEGYVGNVLERHWDRTVSAAFLIVVILSMFCVVRISRFADSVAERAAKWSYFIPVLEGLRTADNGA